LLISERGAGAHGSIQDELGVESRIRPLQAGVCDFSGAVGSALNMKAIEPKIGSSGVRNRTPGFISAIQRWWQRRDGQALQGLDLQLAWLALDSVGEILRISPAAEALLGVRMADVAGKRWMDVLGVLAPADQVASGVRTGYCRADGHLCNLHYLVLPGSSMEVDASASSVVWISDISQDLAALQESAEHARLRTAACFASQIAHEVRNPVAAISGSAQLLRLLAEKARGGDARSVELLQAEQDALCRSIAAESERLDQIIARFLSFADISEDNLRLLMELPDDETPSEHALAQHR
jgi:signal transduction histidine kinase